MLLLYLHPQDVWHCTLKTRPYILLFVKKCLEIQSSSNKRVPVLIFLNDLRSTSRWNVPIWPTCHRPNKSPHSDRHWNLKTLDNCCSLSRYVLLSSLFMGSLSFLLNYFFVVLSSYDAHLTRAQVSHFSCLRICQYLQIIYKFTINDPIKIRSTQYKEWKEIRPQTLPYQEQIATLMQNIEAAAFVKHKYCIQKHLW